MSEKKTLVAQVRDSAQAFVAVAMVCTILGGGAVKVWGLVNAGPEAKRQVAEIVPRVGKMERQMRFLLWAAEKQTKTTYRDWARERRQTEDAE